MNPRRRPRRQCWFHDVAADFFRPPQHVDRGQVGENRDIQSPLSIWVKHATQVHRFITSHLTHARILSILFCLVCCKHETGRSCNSPGETASSLAAQQGTGTHTVCVYLASDRHLSLPECVSISGAPAGILEWGVGSSHLQVDRGKERAGRERAKYVLASTLKAG